ncbi:hypothetical protein SAMN05216275_16215 [Streptosporangium canum]|uniref:Uncharacterized protein n=1 Tax=Streptosporangium canum TaxID=324952 RepID=A0A1I4FFM8_9ACTN|nr:hypothetical protein [Streptosporangium canum]SFL16253.1 hypothetical protein SAMN05216275_16215 [Streptosporangium canum]
MGFMHHLGAGAYTTALATTSGGMAIATPNLAFATVGRTLMLQTGVMLSSPSDIDALVKGLEELIRDLDETKKSVKTADTAVDDEHWKKMGREEHDAVVKEYCEQIDRSKACITDLSRALGGVATMSAVGAGACLALSCIFLGFAVAKRSALLFGPAAAAAGEAVATMLLARLRIAAANIFKNNARAWGSAAGIVGFAGFIISQIMSSDFNEVTPTNQDKTPDFEQAVIKNLPQETSSSSRLPSSLSAGI